MHTLKKNASKSLFEKLPAEGLAKLFNVVLAGNCPAAALAAVYGKQCGSVAAFQKMANESFGKMGGHVPHRKRAPFVITQISGRFCLAIAR